MTGASARRWRSWIVEEEITVRLVFPQSNPYSPAPIVYTLKQLLSKNGVMGQIRKLFGPGQGDRSMAKCILALTLVVCLASASALCAQEMTKPLGKWERKIGKDHVALVVEDNRLHIIYAGEKGVTVHADYAMTRDGLVFGVVTSIECDEDQETDMAKTLFDAPFCFRFRIDEGALIVHDMKAHDADSKDDMWNGRYKSVRSTTTRDGIVPTSCTVPSGSPFPYYSAQPATSNSSSSSAPTGGQTLNYWMGFTR